MTVAKMGLAGLLYGVGLVIAGLMLAGAGHGTALLLDAASAPLSFLRFPLPLISTPLMWCLVWCLLGSSHKSPQRQIVFLALLVHYFSILFAPLFEPYPEGEYLAKMFDFNPGFVILCGAYYLAGQAFVWGLLV